MPGIVPNPESPPFGTVGATEPGTAPPVDEAVVGAGVPGVGVADDDVEDPDAGKTQEPVLGFELAIMAAPPKSQLVCPGFF